MINVTATQNILAQHVPLLRVWSTNPSKFNLSEFVPFQVSSDRNVKALKVSQSTGILEGVSRKANLLLTDRVSKSTGSPYWFVHESENPLKNVKLFIGELELTDFEVEDNKVYHSYSNLSARVLSGGVEENLKSKVIYRQVESTIVGAPSNTKVYSSVESFGGFEIKTIYTEPLKCGIITNILPIPISIVVSGPSIQLNGKQFTGSIKEIMEGSHSVVNGRSFYDITDPDFVEFSGTLAPNESVYLYTNHLIVKHKELSAVEVYDNEILLEPLKFVKDNYTISYDSNSSFTYGFPVQGPGFLVYRVPEFCKEEDYVASLVEESGYFKSKFPLVRVASVYSDLGVLYTIFDWYDNVLSLNYETSTVKVHGGFLRNKFKYNGFQDNLSGKFISILGIKEAAVIFLSPSVGSGDRILENETPVRHIECSNSDIKNLIQYITTLEGEDKWDAQRYMAIGEGGCVDVVPPGVVVASVSAQLFPYHYEEYTRGGGGLDADVVSHADEVSLGHAINYSDFGEDVTLPRGGVYVVKSDKEIDPSVISKVKFHTPPGSLVEYVR